MRGKKLTTEQFIEKAKKIHGLKYEYSKSIYINKRTKIEIICSNHGSFWQLPLNHLNYTHNCPHCLKINKINELSDILNRFKKKHGSKFDYSEVNYKGMNANIKIKCVKHNLFFFQTPNSHCKGSECPLCRYEKSSASKLNDIDDVLSRFKKIYDNRYDYSEFNYTHFQKQSVIKCKIHGAFLKSALSHLNGSECPKCTNNVSKPEIEVQDFIKSLGFKIQVNVRNVINPLELDIYIPEKQIAIEFNGLYWHSDLFKEDKYHLKKLEECESKDIKLIQIFEDEWLNKQEIVKSRLRNILGKIENKIYARNCVVKELDSKTVTKFLNENHLQGSVGSKIKLGLFHNEELVSIMTFGNLRKNLGQKSKDDTFELLRFCNKLNINIIGGASKLFKYFISNYSCVSVISYADRRWSNGELYNTLGFKHIHNSQPNYFYVKNGEVKREARFKYRKDILVSEGFDKNKTEKQIMIDRNYFRIYDCGAMKFMYEKCGD